MAHDDAVGVFDWSSLHDAARVVRYDARGHGGTPALQFDDWAFRWSSQVDDMLRAAGSGPFVAGGTGMGCATALYAALRAPRRVQGLVLAAPPVAWEARAAEARRYEAAAALVETRGLGAWVESSSASLLPPLLDELPGARDVTIRHLLAMEEKAVSALLRGAAASDLPGRDEIRSIVMPALILAWPDDPGHPLATAQSLAELLVLSEIHVARDLSEVRAWPRRVGEFLSGLCQWE
jgi:pimeloyl-ACP methyl ester carboxylesterase